MYLHFSPSSSLSAFASIILRFALSLCRLEKKKKAEIYDYMNYAKNAFKLSSRLS
jgi:hypothetical protein